MDTSRLKSKLRELKSSNGERRVLWKPKPGTQTVRIVPYTHDPDWPFIELFFHYNITKKTMISPTSFGRPDPIKEFAEELQSTGDRDEWKHGKKLEPKKRTYVPILVRGEEDQGVKFWGFGTQIYEQLLKKIENPKWGDITHPTEGRDIEVTFEKATSDNSFPKTTIDVDPERTPVTRDMNVLESLKEMPDIKTLWSEPSYEELQGVLKEYVDQGARPVDTPSYSRKGEDTKVEQTIKSGTSSVAASTAETTSDDDIKGAFSSYFNK